MMTQCVNPVVRGQASTVGVMTEPATPTVTELFKDGFVEADEDSAAATRFRQIEVVLADLASVPINGVTVVEVAADGDLFEAFDRTGRVAQTELAAVVVDLRTPPDGDLSAELIDDLRDLVQRDRPSMGLLIQREADESIVGWLGYAPSARGGAPDLAAKLKVTAEEIVPAPRPKHTLVLDERIRRMLRFSVQSRSAVMLVGPPGTGKTHLLHELAADIQNAPAAYGLKRLKDPMVVTPDESWTARELVGGDTVDDHGRLRFSPGHVLEAIHRNRWLVLDEANRADLDRIFAGLFTWLSGQSVEVGRVSSDPQAGPVILGWSDTPRSKVIGAGWLRGKESSRGPVYYLAGTDWRLLGTYNAVDAQRVFRFGQALGRRFDHIPVPLPGNEAFSQALEARLGDITAGLTSENRAELAAILRDIYRAHSTISDALGPAALLAIPQYVAVGMRAGETAVRPLVAEAYLAGMGTWLGGLGDDLTQLGESLRVDTVLGTEWQWITSRLNELR